MASYRLLRAADNDLGEIADYTIEKHGVAQARVYRDSLLRALETIADNPGIGSNQNHILPALRRFVHESHSIYYRVEEGGVVILRLLGPGQDPLSQFQNAPTD